MSEWTQSARAELERYLARAREALSDSDADAAEVVEDLRRHAEQEAVDMKLGVVTEEDARRIVARLGTPEPSSPPANPAQPPSAEPQSPAPSPRKRPGWWLLFPLVILPLITIVFEFLTGICAMVLFDPLINFGHVIMTLLVPGLNLWVWLALRRNPPSNNRWLGLANGIALGVALFYALMLVPVIPFAGIGVIYFGIGLIPLSPLLALLAGMWLRRHLRKSMPAGRQLRGLWSGMTVGAGGIVLFALPFIMTETGMRLAISDDAATADRGVSILRVTGLEEQMLRHCYGRGMSEARGFYSWGTVVPAEKARVAYYRARGRAFNTVPPPKLYAGRARWAVMEEEFTWDNDQGGDAVAGRVKGLALTSSRMDGAIDPDAALGYLEWTLEFQNDSLLQREARAQIALPPGAVVSRLTLWIDGEEREAAFAGRAKVKAAYKEVVAQRRDPVLVTTCGPDRVLMQCFPVPPSGGRMKVRLGITAPLGMTNLNSGFLQWPHFIERNFTIRDSFQHLLWMAGPTPLEPVGKGLTAEPAKNGGGSLHGKLNDPELNSPGSGMLVRRDPAIRSVWTADTRSTPGTIIRQTLVEKAVTTPARVAVVVDGSREMEEVLPDVADALAAIPNTTEVLLLLARDGCREIAGPAGRLDDARRAQAAQALRGLRCVGGHDNVPALVRACDFAAATNPGVVVWIHGSQPVVFDTAAELQQRLERGASGLSIIEAQARTGPNRLTETFDSIRAFRSLGGVGGLRPSLETLFRGWKAGATVIEAQREKVQSPPPVPAEFGKETSGQLTRLWAFDEARRLMKNRKNDEAAQLASTSQLVTPVSGAVVLETREQYARAGLEPADPNSVPVVPEPSFGSLLLIAAALALSVIHRRQPAGRSLRRRPNIP
jgi:hypothetical protein